MTLRAYAKINLGLRVLEKRPDGYHEIETILHRVYPYDKITLEPADTISMECIPNIFPSVDRNLCLKAATALKEYCRVETGVRMTLRKNIPIGAGLGGGSSNAAVTLLGLIRLWKLAISEEELRTMALFLGSDVPYFLHAGTAYATGRGELLEYFECDIPYWIVLVYPNITLYTAWAYANVGIPNRTERPKLKSILNEHLHNPLMLATLLQNDFEPMVVEAHAPVGEVKQALYDGGAVFAQMSGSGSSVYGFFAEETAAERIARTMSERYKVYVTPPNFSPRIEN